MGYSQYIILESEEERDKIFDFLEKNYPEKFMIDVSYQDRDYHKFIIGCDCVVTLDILEEMLILSYILWRYRNKPKSITIIYDGMEMWTQEMSDKGVNLNIVKLVKHFKYITPINVEKIIGDLEIKYDLEPSFGK